MRLFTVQPKRAGLDLVMEFMQTDLARVLEERSVLGEDISRLGLYMS